MASTPIRPARRWYTRWKLSFLLALTAFLVNCVLLLRYTSSTTPTDTTKVERIVKEPAFVIDIVTVGSMTRPNYQETQLQTFGSHPSVRHFFRLTEFNDTEVDCHRNLTTEQVHAVRYRCSKDRKKYSTLQYFNRLFASPQYLEKKGERKRNNTRFYRLPTLTFLFTYYYSGCPSPSTGNAAGWLCAQKRPLDGLYAIFRDYYCRQEDLPDYLFLLDDDSYVQMPAVLEYLQQFNGAHVFAGCLSRVRWMNFSFPYGGWGTFLSRKALELWRHRLYCRNQILTDFEEFACNRLKENQIGELSLFQEGMSLLELMHRYSANQPYLNFDQWNDVGFCLHSDTALAYFVNFYRIAEHATSIPGGGHPRGKVMYYEEDRLLGYNGSVRFAGQQLFGSRKQKKECLHKNDTLCTLSSHLCHYITPEHMVELFDQQQRLLRSVD